jgi:uncharacterized protein (DUF362 family)/NAD-dependent dihydropyrimidine dehydrogenase PreA subunit
MKGEIMNTRVALTCCEDYEYEKVLGKVTQGLNLLGGMSAFISRGDKVLLKPNFLSARAPEKCVTTHPAVVKAVAQLVLDAGGRPIIGDSPSIGTSQSVAKVSGVEEIARELGIEVVEFESAEFKNPDGKVFKNFVLGKVVKEVDKIINLPKLKTHINTYMTLAVKNLFGCVPGMRKTQWHLKTSRETKRHFAQMLVDLHNLVKPSLSIVDGIVGMEGNGPGSGPPRRLGVLVAGADCFSVDRVIAEVVGAEPDLITTLEKASSGDYGVTDLAEIEVVGEQISAVRVMDFKFPPSAIMAERMVKILSTLLKDGVTHRPVISKERCAACKECVQVCPVACILAVRDGFMIEQSRCIQCHCCIEVCPEGAIDLKEGNYLRAYAALKKGQRTVQRLFGR